MRVCLETTSLRTKLTGVGQYTLGLANALQSGHPDLELISFDGLKFRPLSEALARQQESDGGRKDAVEGKIYQLARGFRPLRTAFRKAKAVGFRSAVPPLDLFHALNFVPPSESNTPAIPLIYDLSHAFYPETHPKERTDWLAGRLAKLNNYPIINTISNFIADEIAEMYSYPRSQIRVTHPGVKLTYLNPAAKPVANEIAGRVLQPSQYLLSVGTLEPRKNLGTVVEAFSMLSQEERKAIPLVIAGQYGWGQNDVTTAVKLRAEGSLIIAGYVDEAVLRTLYSNAKAFLFPSIYEGFGMPIAEAMACGTPVIASDIPVFREVAGDTISYAGAKRAEAWRDAIRRVIAISDSERVTLVSAARSRASTYTWEKNAAATRAMYEERLA